MARIALLLARRCETGAALPALTDPTPRSWRSAHKEVRFSLPFRYEERGGNKNKNSNIGVGMRNQTWNGNLYIVMGYSNCGISSGGDINKKFNDSFFYERNVTERIAER